MTRREFNKLKEMLQPIHEAWNDPEKPRYRLDELGKIQQTVTGTGEPYDPFKYWTIGMAVEAGKWYQCEDENGYIWEAIKSGIPSSDTDEEYFDVVGI